MEEGDASGSDNGGDGIPGEGGGGRRDKVEGK